MKEKLCLWCKHFYFQSEIPDWSEYTPSSSASVGCSLDKFEIDVDNDTTAIYRQKLLTAKTCKDYRFDVILEDEVD